MSTIRLNGVALTLNGVELTLNGPDAVAANATASGSLPLGGAAVAAVVPPGRWVSQTGSNANPGTFDLPYATIQYGWSQCAPGETLWIKDDLTPTAFSSTSTGIILTVSGTAGNPITLRGWPEGTRRRVNLVNHSFDTWGGTGVRVVANHAILRDIHFDEMKAPLRSAPYVDGVNWRGTNGQMLNCEISDVEGRGLTISENGLATNLLVQNCDFHDCYDPRSATAYTDADGIQLFNGATGIIIEACRIWNCSDDGIDMFFQTAPVTIRDCWVWDIGYREDGVTAGGDGTGLKVGSASRGANHQIQRNLIFDCRVYAISNNDSTVASTWEYNTSIDCSGGYEVFTNGVATTLNGNAKFGGSNTLTGSAVVRNRNSFDTPPGITESAGWFISLSRVGVDGARGAGGALPVLDFAKPSPGSDLIGSGPGGTTIGAFAAAFSGATGTASGTLPLTGSATAAALARAAATGTLPLAGSAAAAALARALAAGTLPLDGSATGAVLARAVATGTLPLTGSATAAALARAAATGTLPLTGSATGAVLARAVAAGTLPLDGSAVAVAVQPGALAAGTLPLGGSASATALARAAASGTLALSGSATGAARAAAAAAGTMALSGSASAAARATAAALGVLPLAGSATARAQALGTAAGILPLGGSAEAKATAQAIVQGLLDLGGSAEAVAAPLIDYTRGRLVFATAAPRAGTVLNTQRRRGRVLNTAPRRGTIITEGSRAGTILNPDRAGRIVELTA